MMCVHQVFVADDGTVSFNSARIRTWGRLNLGSASYADTDDRGHRPFGLEIFRTARGACLSFQAQPRCQPVPFAR